MSRDNAGQRVLNARRVLCGAEESLENTFGGTLPDGAQCFVIEEQANYRFLQTCTLPEDGQYVVMPKGDKRGRWVRAEGLVGFALLEGGKLDDAGVFGGWTYQKLVQFEVTKEALVYVGGVPRLAQFTAHIAGAQPSVILLQGTPRQVATESGAALIHPGERIVLTSAAFSHESGSPVGAATLQVTLA